MFDTARAVEQFRDAIQNAGLPPPHIVIPGGKLHRFATNGKPKDDSGWYVFHEDGIPAGAFGDWRTGACPSDEHNVLYVTLLSDVALDEVERITI